MKDLNYHSARYVRGTLVVYGEALYSTFTRDAAQLILTLCHITSQSRAASVQYKARTIRTLYLICPKF